MIGARQALAAWLDHLALERRASPRTVRAYGDNVLAYLNFLERHRGEALSVTDLGGVTAAELRAYLAFRREPPSSREGDDRDPDPEDDVGDVAPEALFLDHQ